MGSLIVWAWGLPTGCSDAGVTAFNADPSAEITSHQDGDTVREGYVESLRGVVGDPDNQTQELMVTWLVGGAAVCLESAPGDDGLVVCDHIFAPGAGSVVLEVRDPGGGAGSDAVALDVQATDAPTAVIATPETDGVYYNDTLIRFRGAVADGEDTPDQLTVAWETSELGDLGLQVDVTTEGEVEAFGELAEGDHAVRLRVTDSTGKDAVDSVVITVGPPNSAPSCSITSPADGSASAEGAEVRFEATVDDVDVPADWLAVVWESDKDGLLGESTPDTDGTVGFAYGDLTVATHSITLTVTDEMGATCADSIFYAVGTPPVLSVTSPADGEVLNETSSVAFAATVSDGEDLPTGLALSWSSDLDGEFSTQGADSTGVVAFSVSDLTPGTHALTVRATDTDGLYTQSSLGFTINQVPTAPTVTLAPDPAQTADSLVATAAGSTDPDTSGTVTYSYAWFEDGATSSVSTSASFPSSSTAKDHVYKVLVTPSDGTGVGAPGEAELTVQNTPPDLTAPSLSASGVQVGDTLTCSATATDADAVDTPTVSYAWHDGSAGSTYAVTSADDPGDTITCTATADDGDGGTDTDTASATVTNSDPVMGTVTVSPETARVGETLTCTASATDADGDTPTTTYSWTDGSTASTYTVVEGDDPSDTVTCTATATDAEGGTDTGSASATVENTDPVVSAVSVTPSTGAVGDTLSCGGSATDADGDTPTLSYVWSDGSTSSAYTIQSSDAPGDAVTCTVTATDADGGTDTDSSSATVTNTAPTLSSVTLSPSTVQTDDTLNASVTTSDVNGDTVSISYAWYVSGGLVGETGSTLDGATYFDKDEDVYVIATGDDGTDTTSATSSTVTVVNSPPGAPVVTIDPSEPAEGEDLLCEVATESSDADDDTVTYTMTWEVDGMTYAAGGTTDTGGLDSGDSGWVGPSTTTWPGDTVDGGDLDASQTWVCTVTPNDSDDDGTQETESVTVEQECESGSMAVGNGDVALIADWSAALDATYDDLTAEVYLKISQDSVDDLGYVLTSYDSASSGPLWMDASELNDWGLSIDSWAHVAVVWDSGAGEVRTYIDGALANTDSWSQATIGAHGLYIGGPTYAYTHRCNCELAALRISSSPLYTTSFVPEDDYGVDSDTLMLVPMTDFGGEGAIDEGPDAIALTASSNATTGDGGPYCWAE